MVWKTKRVVGRLIITHRWYQIHTWRYYTLFPLLNPNTTMDVEYFRPSVNVACLHCSEKERPNALTTFGCSWPPLRVVIRVWLATSSLLVESSWIRKYIGHVRSVGLVCLAETPHTHARWFGDRAGIGKCTSLPKSFKIPPHFLTPFLYQKRSDNLWGAKHTNPQHS